MSDAAAASRDIFNFNVCSQCLHPFLGSGTRDARHAIPCGHVFCKECVGKAEAEQKSGKSFCRRAGCERDLAPVSKFAVAWGAQRLGRLTAKHDGVFGDQGNVGDRAPPPCSECDPDPGTGKPHLATHRCETCGDGVYFCDDVAAVHRRLKATKDHVAVALPPPAGPRHDPEPAWDVCAEHKLPFRVVEASNQRPLCSECLVSARGKVPVQTFDEAIAALETAASAAATSAELTRQRSKLAEPIFTADELCARVAKWGAQETARIMAWEEREVKQVQAVAAECVSLVEQVCARRIEVGASLITQRMGLCASFEEFEQALADLPRDPAARLSKLRAVHSERKQLCLLLADRKIIAPSAQEVLKWAELPTLSSEFDPKAADKVGVLARAISSAATAMLSKVLAHAPLKPMQTVVQTPEGKAQPPEVQGSSARPSKPTPDWREFPVIPELDAFRGLRSIPLGAKASAFAGLDDDTIVVGLEVLAPLEVWDLASGELVRQFEGMGQKCRSIIKISDERIAVGWHTWGGKDAVSIFDGRTGKLLQNLILNVFGAVAMTFVEEHLITMCSGSRIHVWNQDSAGKFTEKALYTTGRTLHHAMTVMSPSLIAVSLTCYDSGTLRIDVVNLNEGMKVGTLTAGFTGSVLRPSRLPDGQLLVVEASGLITVGSPDYWTSSRASHTRCQFSGVLVGHDGSFVTTDNSGNVKLWRDGACEVTLTGGPTSSSTCAPLAVVGRRLVVLGDHDNILVSE